MPEARNSMIGFAPENRLRITGAIVFETAWRIGSGKEGETMCDLGVVLDSAGSPVLPGSSLKGKLRSTCESLAHALGLSACLLNNEASQVPCVSDVKFYQRVRSSYQRACKTDLAKRLAWIDGNTCDVCKLFGSPVRASRLRISDGRLDPGTWPGVVQVRDGVVLDRDSHTAVDGLKYDYEVLPVGSRFEIVIELEDCQDEQLALIGAAIFEWHAGSSLGGFSSRGLGRFRLEDVRVAGVDFADVKQVLKFLTHRTPKERFTELTQDWEAFFAERINQRLGAITATAKEVSS